MHLMIFRQRIIWARLWQGSPPLLLSLKPFAETIMELFIKWSIISQDNDNLRTVISFYQFRCAWSPFPHYLSEILITQTDLGAPWKSSRSLSLGQVPNLGDQFGHWALLGSLTRSPCQQGVGSKCQPRGEIISQIWSKAHIDLLTDYFAFLLQRR